MSDISPSCYNNVQLSLMCLNTCLVVWFTQAGLGGRLSKDRPWQTYFPGNPVAKIPPSNAGRVSSQSLVGELRSYMPCGQKNPKHKKQKQYCNKFNKDFKNWSTLKKILKKKNRPWEWVFQGICQTVQYWQLSGLRAFGEHAPVDVWHLVFLAARAARLLLFKVTAEMGREKLEQGTRAQCSYWDSALLLF